MARSYQHAFSHLRKSARNPPCIHNERHISKAILVLFFLLHARSYANAERRQVARLPEGVHRVRVQKEQLKRRLRAIVSCADGQCGGRTSRGRRIDSGGDEMFNNSFQGLF